MENLMFEEITEEEAFNIDGGSWWQWAAAIAISAAVIAIAVAISVASEGSATPAVETVGSTVLEAIWTEGGWIFAASI